MTATHSSTRAPTISPERRSAIERLMVDYVHAIDEGEYERWPQFFTEDGRYQVTGRDNHARGWVAGMLLCDNRDMMIDRIYDIARWLFHQSQSHMPCQVFVLAGLHLTQMSPLASCSSPKQCCLVHNRSLKTHSRLP